MSSSSLRRLIRAGVLLLGLLTPEVLFAQSLNGGRFELDAGVVWLGGTTFAEVDAAETAFGGRVRPLFVSRSDIKPSSGISGRVAVRLTNTLQAETSIAFNATRLETDISGDAEGAADATVGEPVDQYLLEVGLLARLARWQRGRLAPFAAGGGGYLRQLNDGHTVVESGTSYYVGGGFHYALGAWGSGGRRAVGIRGDVRATILKDGIALDRAHHVMPSVGATFFAHF